MEREASLADGRASRMFSAMVAAAIHGRCGT
jgi:hypothetical protein